MLKSSFQLVQTSDKRFHFSLQSPEGETLMTSQAMARKSDVVLAISEVLEFGVHPMFFSPRLASDFQYYFVLKNQKSQPIGTSPTFKTKLERTKLIQKLEFILHRVDIIDMT